MKKFLSVFMTDFTVAKRNMFFIIVIILAVLYSLIVHFLIPEKIGISSSPLFILDNSNNGIYADLKVNYSQYLTENEEDLKKKLNKNSSAYGIIIYNDTYKIIFQGYESEKQKNVILASAKTFFDSLKGIYLFPDIKSENIGDYSSELPLNKKMIPILISTDIIILCFLFIAVMIFQEKQEGGIYAYRVSPSGTLNYISSKILVNILISYVFGIIFIFLSLGFSVNYFYFSLLIILGSFLISLFGIFLAQFYSSLSEFITVAMVFNMIMILPVILYFDPLMNLKIFRIIISYSIMLSADFIIKGENLSYIIKTFINLSVWIAFMFPLTYFSVRKTLIKKVIL